MKLNLKFPSRYKRKRIALFGVVFSLLLVTNFSLIHLEKVLGYSITVENNVDADSNIDAVANKGTDGTTSYLDAQTKDGTYQNITESNEATPAHNYEDTHDAITNVYAPVDVGTYSDDSNMLAKDDSDNTLTEAQGAGYVAGNDIEDFLDAVTDSQSPTDLGTYSDWTEMQDQDGTYNTLTEENVPMAGGSEFLHVDNYDSTYTGQAITGTTPYLDAEDGSNYIYEKNGELDSVGWFDFQNTSGVGTLTVNVTVTAQSDDTDDGYNVYYDVSGGGGSSAGTVTFTTANVYQNQTLSLGTFTVAEVNQMRIYLESTDTVIDDLYGDHMFIGVSWSSSNNYRFDREIYFSSLDTDETNEELCIYVNTAGSETLDIDVWHSGAWTDIGTDITDSDDGSWVNISITTWLDSATEYFRFEDATTTGDTSSNTWVLDGVLIHSWTDAVNDYEFDREFSFTNLNYSDTYEELCIYTGDTLNTESLEVYVYHSSSWTLLTTITSGQTNTWINTSITTYLDASTEYFSFRDTTQSGDSNQGTWGIDYVTVHTWNDQTIDYELEWEHQTQSIDPDKDFYNITIFGFDPFETGELYFKRGQTYRHFYNADTNTYTYQSDYLVQKTGIVNGSNWVIFDEYPIRYILRLNNGSIKTFSSASAISNYIGLIDNSTIWGVAIESFNGVLAFYLNFADYWGHGQMLYYPRLQDGRITSFTTPLYAVYPHLYANFSGTWYNQLLNNKTLYDASSNPRNNLRFVDTADTLEITFTTNDIDILSSNWNFTHGFKYNLTERRFHPINSIVCNDRSFDDIGFGYEITYTPMSELWYKPEFFIISNSTHSYTANISQVWSAETYISNYLSQVEVISENNERFVFYFDDMQNAGFTKNYLEVHELLLPNGETRKTLLCGMFGFGSYTQGTIIDIDPTFSERVSSDEDDIHVTYDSDGPTYTTIDDLITNAVGWTGPTTKAYSSIMFDTGITNDITAISNAFFWFQLFSSTVDPADYTGAALYNETDETDLGFWNETYASTNDQSYYESIEVDGASSHEYYQNNSFEIIDSTGGHNVSCDAFVDAWVEHHNTTLEERKQYFNMILYLGTGMGAGDRYTFLDRQGGTEINWPKLQFDYELDNEEEFLVQIWNHTQSAWDYANLNLNITTTEQWYNYSISSDYIDGSNQITWRYIDADQNDDTTQNTLHIDYAGVSAYNFTIYGLPNFNSLSITTDSNYHAFLDNPIQFVVESGMSYDVQIRATDLTGTPITDGWIYFNTVDDSGTSTQLTTSYQTLYSDQSKGNNTHSIYFWVNTGWSAGDPAISQQQYQFTINVSITGV